ncbi:type II toxin-antitoxin system RelE/ParE family toxin [Ruminococcus sp.]|uniref:type II toxin-antitoxin system RelE/ParE family toxin n=1 Tax=Ruminococcus sp. TaxID=41978 RepID=UPI002E7785E6|nr:type II toxin-antitoxin system RelE/ParE family toxin [Ruminococcus sp.]MEE1264292.1 type II toxin-antitoxin system RelE/ParE family toxin [Ruminococcus sp.]
MTREFVMLPEFDRKWKELGLTDRELKALQEELTINPQKGDLMQGTGGLRKIRVAFEGRGKSGSARVCYVDFAVYERIYLITAYAKDEKDNLSKAERNEVKKLIHILEATIDRS